ncbi:beta-lactamase-like protein [Mycotypha africana]|uniref:beta-lactamase-like protein n=1 Tax=Mycotypha africana TaxID=64632 RepID=UPI0022FFEEE8|nr:beta-lactamase-like protein [Mycotypha africana]KAI8968486.1 beta-lactamase-like protein [Mycotypha africana]
MSLYESTPRLDLPSLPNFKQLSKTVWRVLGLNPGKFTLQGTNTYIVGSGKRKILIDCGDGQPDYLPLLMHSLKSIDPDAYISDILISHCHTDHCGGLKDILSSEINRPPLDTSSSFISSRQYQQQQFINIHKYPLDTDKGWYKVFWESLKELPDDTTFSDLKDNQVFTLRNEKDKDSPPLHIRVMHTPGHAKDHCAFYLEEEDILFTGDCILGHGSVAFEDLHDYMKSLQRMEKLQPARLFPGHGDVVEDSIQKIHQYIAARRVKENQILDILRQDVRVHWTPIELVEFMSSNGSHSSSSHSQSSRKREYSEPLAAVAVRNVGLHLIKLYFDGKVELTNLADYRKRHGKDLDPYHSENVYTIMNEKWRYIDTNEHNNSKL